MFYAVKISQRRRVPPSMPKGMQFFSLSQFSSTARGQQNWIRGVDLSELVLSYLQQFQSTLAS
jgi:hypothetical protein